ncbi:hypothetical protein [Nonomuraea sp. NPDC049709]|uniref:hypothetical protein n=1 Tax=Nonomuraea sp. NPDC049709 TaxID=3154736 RepID=UPI00343E1DC9
MKAAVKLGVGVAWITGTLTVALLGTTPAQASTGQSGATAAPCRKVADANKDTVRVWYCNGTGGTARGYHAQALLSEGTKVTLRSGSGAILRTKTATHTGVLAQWYNTSTFNSSGGLFKACTGYRENLGTCTRAGS